MKTKQLFMTVGLVLLALVASGCPGRLDSLSTFQSTEENPLAFSSVDVNERQVSVGYPSENVTVMFFSGPGTSDAMQPITAEIAVHFHEAQDIDFVTVVDLRTLSFYERPFAPGAIRDAGNRTVGRINRTLDERGLPAIEGLEEHLFILADDNGDVTQRYGVADPNSTLTCIILERSGREAGRFNPSEDLEGVLQAIETSRNAETAAQEP